MSKFLDLTGLQTLVSNLNTKFNEKAPTANPEFTGTPKAPTAAAGTNTTQIATTEFVQTEIGNKIAASDAMIFKGTLGTGGTVTALPTTHKTGWTYRVVTAGTYAGQKCEVGDLIIALVDRDGSGNTNDDWTVAQTNIDGAITGVSGDSTYINVAQTGSTVSLSHKDVTRTNSTSSATPAFGETISVVASVTSDAKGHVTSDDTVTITIPNATATQTVAGLLSGTDKKKLDGIAGSAEVNQNAFSNVVVGSTTITAGDKTDTIKLVAGTNISLTPDATNKTVTINNSAAEYTHPTTSGNKHIPSGGSAGQILRWASDGTAEWGADNDTTYEAITNTEINALFTTSA